MPVDTERLDCIITVDTVQLPFALDCAMCDAFIPPKHKAVQLSDGSAASYTYLCQACVCTAIWQHILGR